jgi:hypothetical protein
MDRHRLHVMAHGFLRAADPKLCEQKRELLVVRLRQTFTGSAVEIPEGALERAQRFLARLVEELLIESPAFRSSLRSP